MVERFSRRDALIPGDIVQIEGPPGPPGPVGPQGPKGDTSGVIGPTGPKGDTGNTGATGPQGPIGNQGIQGPQGIQGIQGIKGDTGAQGRGVLSYAANGQGQLIVTYSDSSTVNLGQFVGPQGPVGQTGPQGPTGAQGRGIAAVAINGAGHLLVTFTDDPVAQDLGYIIGPQGPQGAQGIQGIQGTRGRPSGLQYTWAVDTGAIDPGNGFVKVNSASLTAATSLYISATDGVGVAVAAMMASWDDSNSAVRGTLFVYDELTPTNFVAYSITGEGTKNVTWFNFPVAHVDHGGTLVQGRTLAVQFTRTGDKGDTGATGATGAVGPQGPVTTLSWTFDTGVADADPGVGKVRFDNSDYTQVGKILFNNTEALGTNSLAFLTSFNASNNLTSKGRLTFVQVTDPSKFATFSVTSPVVDASGYQRVLVTPIVASGPLVGRLSVMFSPAGNKGQDGSGGNVYGPQTATSGNFAVFDADPNNIKDGGKPGALAVRDKIDNTYWQGVNLTIANGGTGGGTVLAAQDGLQISTVGRSNLYSDLSGKPALFDGTWTSLSGKPTDLVSGTLLPSRLPAPTLTDFGGVKSKASVANQFLTSIGLDGVPTSAQPSFSNLSGSATAAQLPLPTTTTIGGVQAKTAVANQFLTALGADGVLVSGQPTFANLSGSATPAQLPLPTTTTIGAVQAKTTVANQFLTSIGTDGVPTSAQPSFGNLSGTATAAQLPLPTTTTIGGVRAKVAVATQFLTAIGADGIPTSAQPAFTDVSGSVAAAQLPAFTGEVTSTAGSTTLTIATGAVTYAKLAAAALATAATDIWTNVANKVLTVAGLWLAHAPTALGSISGTYTANMATFLNATGTVSASLTLANPTNAKAGQAGEILFTMGAGSLTISYGSAWKSLGATPTAPTTNGAQCVLSYRVFDESNIVFTLTKVGA